jgi:hypothetical protein
MNPNNNASSFDGPANGRMPQTSGQNNSHSSPSHIHAPVQPSGQNNSNQGVPPPRSGPTPSHNQHPPKAPTPGGLPAGGPNGPFGAQVSPNMNPLLPFNGQNSTGGNSSNQGPPIIPGMPGAAAFPPPLEKSKFEAAYKTYSLKEGIKHDQRLMSLEGKTIDLYALHMNVMQEGGWSKVLLSYVLIPQDSDSLR